MNEKLELTKMNGMNVSGDVICFLEDTSTQRRFIYYTLNEIVGEGPSATVKIYVGKTVQSAELDTPITDEEWTKLKGLMGAVLKETNDDTIKYLSLSELTNPSIVDEKVIAMPESYDYINKHKKVYADAVGNNGSSNIITPVVEPTVEMTEETLNAPLGNNMFETSVEEPAVETEATEINPVADETPVETKPEEIVEQNIKENANVASVETKVTEDLQTIDINEIEAKYAEMIEDLNKLKEKEIEAAKRYNATLELNAMHNEQHASYIQNEQLKEEATETTVETSDEETVQSEVQPTESKEVTEPIMTTEESNTEPTPIEPTPVEPGSLETNWFDMPIQE